MAKEYEGADDINAARRALTALEMALMPEGQNFKADRVAVAEAFASLDGATRRLEGVALRALDHD